MNVKLDTHTCDVFDSVHSILCVEDFPTIFFRKREIFWVWRASKWRRKIALRELKKKNSFLVCFFNERNVSSWLFFFLAELLVIQHTLTSTKKRRILNLKLMMSSEKLNLKLLLFPLYIGGNPHRPIERRRGIEVLNSRLSLCNLIVSNSSVIHSILYKISTGFWSSNDSTPPSFA